MSSKRKLHHIWVKLRPLSYWYFLILAVISLLVGIYALRANNLTSVRLHEKVMAVDKENGDVEKALQELREHIHSHMNANLASGPTAIKPPVQLKHRYERLVEAERERVSATNQRVYTDAQAICERRFPAGSGSTGRIPCIEAYVEEHGIKQKPIPDAMYKFDFVAPRWSPDLAGFSFLFAGFFGLMFIVRFAAEIWLKRQFE
ncbi:hypothetical protein BH23PAT1_BH23PAT1_1460 [soil metagenome]